jgi:hypothetical protein
MAPQSSRRLWRHHWATRLFIEGGTPNSIGRSFIEEKVEDLIVKRSSPSLRVLERFKVVSCHKNYVGRILRNSAVNRTER